MAGPYFDWSTQDAWGEGAWLPDTWLAGAYGRDVWLPSGGSSYIAKAVHFDGATMLWRGTPMTGVSDSAVGLMSFLAKLNNQGGLKGIWTQCSALNTDGFPNQFSTTSEISIPSGNNGSANDIGVYLTTDDYSNDVEVATPLELGDDTWHHILLSWDTDQIVGSRRVQIAIDGALQSSTFILDEGIAFNVAVSDAATIVGAEGSAGPDDDTVFLGYTGDLGDFYLNVVTTLDLSDQSNIDRFFNGSPVDPSTFPAGACILMSGDASTFGTNQGTGGAFTLTGTITDATTSPSD